MRLIVNLYDILNHRGKYMSFIACKHQEGKVIDNTFLSIKENIIHLRGESIIGVNGIYVHKIETRDEPGIAMLDRTIGELYQLFVNTTGGQVIIANESYELMADLKGRLLSCLSNVITIPTETYQRTIPTKTYQRMFNDFTFLDEHTDANINADHIVSIKETLKNSILHITLSNLTNLTFETLTPSQRTEIINRVTNDNINDYFYPS